MESDCKNTLIITLSPSDSDDITIMLTLIQKLPRNHSFRLCCSTPCTTFISRSNEVSFIEENTYMLVIKKVDLIACISGAECSEHCNKAYRHRGHCCHIASSDFV